MILPILIEEFLMNITQLTEKAIHVKFCDEECHLGDTYLVNV